MTDTYEKDITREDDDEFILSEHIPVMKKDIFTRIPAVRLTDLTFCLPENQMDEKTVNNIADLFMKSIKKLNQR